MSRNHVTRHGSARYTPANFNESPVQSAGPGSPLRASRSPLTVPLQPRSRPSEPQDRPQGRPGLGPQRSARAPAALGAYLGISSWILRMKSDFSAQPLHTSPQSSRIRRSSLTRSLRRSAVLRSICLSAGRAELRSDTPGGRGSQNPRGREVPGVEGTSKLGFGQR